MNIYAFLFLSLCWVFCSCVFFWFYFEGKNRRNICFMGFTGWLSFATFYKLFYVFDRKFHVVTRPCFLSLGTSGFCFPLSYGPILRLLGLVRRRDPVNTGDGEVPCTSVGDDQNYHRVPCRLSSVFVPDRVHLSDYFLLKVYFIFRRGDLFFIWSGVSSSSFL